MGITQLLGRGLGGLTVKRVAGAVVLLVLLICVILGGLVATGVVKQPTVQSVQTEWGDTTNSTTKILATVTVDNPNPVGVPSAISIEHRIRMNKVTVAEGSTDGVGLSPGRNRVNLTATLSNDRIEDWWVTHINNGEESTMTVNATVKGPLGVSRDVTRQRQIQTDILSAFEGADRRTTALTDNATLSIANQIAE